MAGIPGVGQPPAAGGGGGATTETSMDTFKEFLYQYNRVSEQCFTDCVRDFTSRTVSSKEEKCAENCLDKFLKMTQRLSIRFQEHQLLQQETMGPVVPSK